MVFLSHNATYQKRKVSLKVSVFSFLCVQPPQHSNLSLETKARVVSFFLTPSVFFRNVRRSFRLCMSAFCFNHLP